MKLSFFKDFLNRKQHDEAEEAQISEAIDNFKAQPEQWDELKMGAAPEIRHTILERLLGDMQQQQVRKLKRSRFIAKAAAIVFLLGTAGMVYEYKGQLLALIDPVDVLVMKTRKGETKKIELSDGSIVWLNGGSSLSYPERFNAAERQVELLDGEAYFDIHHENKRPFRVKTGKTLTNVLGTAFNISAYSRSETINVTVSRGKVAVNKEVLLPNDQLIYRKSTGITERKKLAAAEVISWLQGRLSLNDEEFSTVAAVLENKFNVNIRFDDQKMASFRFTARFETKDSLYDILDALTMTRGLSYQAKGAVITIKNQPN